MRIKGKTVCITGGASGIGRALVLECAVRGASVICADLNLEGAQETASLLQLEQGQTCAPFLLDVSDPTSWQALHKELQASGTKLNGLINNAGVTYLATASETSASDIERIMAINFMGQVHGCQEFLPELTARDEAFICNIVSLFGLVPKAGQAAYCASKFALRAFTEVLALEAQGSALSVSAVYPGHVATDILNNAAKMGNLTHAGLSPDEERGLGQYFKHNGVPAEEAARIIVDGVEAGERRILIGEDTEQLDRDYREDPESVFDTPD